jgi:hypothetical protein
MPNLHRGEIEACLDGKQHKLCLTLGALAELESTFGESDMLALAERFSRGRISANDAISIIGAGLRGGGLDVPDSAVAAMKVAGGAAGFVAIVAQLLGATFGDNSAGETPNGDRRSKRERRKAASTVATSSSSDGAMADGGHTNEEARAEAEMPRPFRGTP